MCTHNLVLSKYKKNLLKIFIFHNLRKIYILHGCVFVMNTVYLSEPAEEKFPVFMTKTIVF